MDTVKQKLMDLWYIKLDPQTKVKYSMRIFAISLFLLMINLIGIYATILLGITLASIGIILLVVYDIGPLNYLSPQLKKLLIQRSIFDLM